MKKTLFIFTIFSSFFVFAQNESICLEVGGWTYIVSINDSTMEYTFSTDGNLIETGIVEWERGKCKISENKIILRSNKPFNETTLQKVILVKVNMLTDDAYYFKSCWSFKNKNEIWKIKKVKNGGFIDHLNKIDVNIHKPNKHKS